MEDFGQVVFKIDQVLEEKKISKNKLEKEANFKEFSLILSATTRSGE